MYMCNLLPFHSTIPVCSTILVNHSIPLNLVAPKQCGIYASFTAEWWGLWSQQGIATLELEGEIWVDQIWLFVCLIMSEWGNTLMP